MPSETNEFCPNCGAQVFAKDPDQSVKSRFDIVLACSCCDFEGTVSETFSTTREYGENKVLKLQYIKFPPTYKAPEDE